MNFNLPTISSAVKFRLSAETLHVDAADSFCDPIHTTSSIVPLQYVPLHIRELDKAVDRCLNDSGSQIAIIRRNILDTFPFKRIGQIHIRGLVGDSIQAELTYLNISLPENPNFSLRIAFAVCDDINEEMIIPSCILQELNDAYNEYFVSSHCLQTESANFSLADSDQTLTSTPRDQDSSIMDDAREADQLHDPPFIDEDLNDDVMDPDDVDADIDPGSLTAKELCSEQLRDV